MINDELKKYIENNIYPEYDKNDSGHNIEHIRYVTNKSFLFAKDIKNIDMNMVFVVAAYHDIGHHIDCKNHEVISAQILENDQILKKFFASFEIEIMKETVEDHRASLDRDPRNIYGKIVSSADRNTDIATSLKRTYAYRLKHSPNSPLEVVIEESRQHLLEKFGSEGYATQKMYFKDTEYERYLKEIKDLCSNKDLFDKKFIEINKLKEMKNLDAK